MSLSQALSAAMSGLRATQIGLSTVAANVANAETPGYVRKTPTQVTTAAGDFNVGVRVAGIQRELDLYVQRQLQIESSGGSYAGLRADFYQRLQQIYGQPGSDSALETVFNGFTTALQALTTSPDSAAARNAVLSAAQVLTQQLHGMTNDLQALRADAELGLAEAVQRANAAMAQIAKINQQLASLGPNDATAAVLSDQRDAYVDQLAELMDVRVIAGNDNQITVFTSSGIQLVGNEASQLTFDLHGAMTALSAWSADPAERTVGTIQLVSPNGSATDLIISKAIRSGRIAAYLEMRDQVLPQAQAQLDEIAAVMASALSDRSVAGTPVVGPPAGFDLDTGLLSAGNAIRLTYTDPAGNQRRISIIRVDDPAALPLSDSATSDVGDTVVGVDFSGGIASVVAQLNSALGATFLQFSNPAGNTLRVVDDGAGNKIDVNAASLTTTVTGLTGGSAELPFFHDANIPYTGAFTVNGKQSIGFAGRITVNAALLADPSRLVVYQAAPLTPAADGPRPNFLFDRLTSAALTFSPQTGIGTETSPYVSPLPAFMRQMISQQGEAAAAAESLRQGQDIVVNSLRQRFADASAVNVDAEMATLLKLQNAYGANARVMAELQRQLGSGMKSTTYAGIGLDRGLAVGLRTQLSAIGGLRHDHDDRDAAPGCADGADAHGRAVQRGQAGNATRPVRSRQFRTDDGTEERPASAARNARLAQFAGGGPLSVLGSCRRSALGRDPGPCSRWRWIACGLQAGPGRTPAGRPRGGRPRPARHPGRGGKCRDRVGGSLRAVRFQARGRHFVADQCGGRRSRRGAARHHGGFHRRPAECRRGHHGRPHAS
jgi:flagellar hook-associated protein 1